LLYERIMLEHLKGGCFAGAEWWVQVRTQYSSPAFSRVYLHVAWLPLHMHYRICIPRMLSFHDSESSLWPVDILHLPEQNGCMQHSQSQCGLQMPSVYGAKRMEDHLKAYGAP
jgi:hypothetical protein